MAHLFISRPNWYFMVLIDASTRWSRMYCYPQEIMLSMIICSNYQIKEHIIRNTQSNPYQIRTHEKWDIDMLAN